MKCIAAGYTFRVTPTTGDFPAPVSCGETPQAMPFDVARRGQAHATLSS